MAGQEAEGLCGQARPGHLPHAGGTAGTAPPPPRPVGVRQHLLAASPRWHLLLLTGLQGVDRFRGSSSSDPRAGELGQVAKGAGETRVGAGGGLSRVCGAPPPPHRPVLGAGRVWDPGLLG
ncbi:hypothetical protein HaLaN_20665 [Haematococcus lacustris]|uniref:Uncharacterized protein n=1 Tax=Haematococcus lacustris TaxID=44745 RepID=A0A699ZM38_HAELA|nr:hypothetical protein HaLaN_20665 [Haematococcus lacustris]